MIRKFTVDQPFWYYVYGMEAIEKYIFKEVHNEFQILAEPDTVQQEPGRVKLHTTGCFASYEEVLEDLEYWEDMRLEAIGSQTKALNKERDRILRRRGCNSQNESNTPTDKSNTD